MPRIIVIGAGVMGASIAYRLATAGASVTVLEAGRIGGGTSTCSFAWTNSNDKEPRAYHDLNVAGMKAHAALAEEFGTTPWWHGGGNVEWAAPEDRAAQQAKVERLRAWGYAAEWITPGQLLELEPDIDPAPDRRCADRHIPCRRWLARSGGVHRRHAGRRAVARCDVSPGHACPTPSNRGPA
jgi:glycine/D-amino acid oxidase-like deaminating enzyme